MHTYLHNTHIYRYVGAWTYLGLAVVISNHACGRKDHVHDYQLSTEVNKKRERCLDDFFIDYITIASLSVWVQLYLPIHV